MTLLSEIRLIRARDRDIGSKLVINGTEIARVNFDDHGSEGEKVLEQIHRNLASLAGLPAVVLDVSDAEFDAAL